MYRTRHFPRPEPPAPRPLSALSRAQLCGRIHVNREALDLLWGQSERDGCEPSSAIGSLKVELIRLEQQLRDQDAAERGAGVSDAAREIALAPFAVRLALAGRTPPLGASGSPRS
jgi:hypothetical protein